MKAIGNLMFSLVLSVLSVSVGGAVVRYGWNNFIVLALPVQTISLPVAIGIDLLVTYITGYATQQSVADVYAEYDGWVRTLVVFIVGLTMSGYALLAMFIVTLFI